MNRSKSLARRLKRVTDIVLAGFGLVLTAPVLALIAACILVTSGRPVLFRQERVGQGGRPFVMLKFRTMVPGAEQQIAAYQERNQRDGPLFKMQNDPRVTPIGRFLRSTSLDELPQLWNVLVGDMSMVGPRPALFTERAKFPPELLMRETVPQGITGLWQLEGRGEAAFDRYRQLDLQYVREWRLSRDLWILVRTPTALIRHAFRERGARRISRSTHRVIDGGSGATRRTIGTTERGGSVVVPYKDSEADRHDHPMEDPRRHCPVSPVVSARDETRH